MTWIPTDQNEINLQRDEEEVPKNWEENNEESQNTSDSEDNQDDEDNAFPFKHWLMNQTNNDNEYLFHAIDDMGLGRTGFTVRKEVIKDAKNFIWDIKRNLSDILQSGAVNKILSADFERITATPITTPYAIKFKSTLALLKLERETETPPTPTRQKQNVIISDSKATQGKKKRTSSPERTETGDLDQRLNQLHLATTNHTKSAVEILEHKLEDIKVKQHKFEETITATLKKVTQLQADKVQHMIDKQNQDIQEAVTNIEHRHKEAEEMQQEKILSMIGGHLELQMENLAKTMLHHMDKKFERLEQTTNPDKRKMIVPPSPASLIKTNEETPMEMEEPEGKNNVLTLSPQKEVQTINGEALCQGSGN